MDPLSTLVVEDERAIRFFLREALEREGYSVREVSSGEEALDILQDTRFDIAILDLMLGGRVDGQRVLEAIRWRWPRTIVIMITAHGSLESAVDAIREGVDGYLLKPVRADAVRQAVREAIARRQDHIGQGDQESESLLRRGPFAVDLSSHNVAREGETLHLTPSEFRLLVHMMQNVGQAVTPIDLVEAVREYRPSYQQEARQIIKWYIHRLRQKIEPDPTDPRYVVNVRGVGYMLDV
jgi:DNA-binding response OmpR family regulator